MELSGQTALVIGGTNGIGRAVALELGKRGARVTIVGRDKVRGEEVAMQIGGVFRRCDASLIREVRRVVHETVQDQGRTDICVLTQGIATVQGRTETSEGLDVKMALHYYSRVAAMEALRQEGAFATGSHPRMLTVLSGGIHSPYIATNGDWELRDSYSLKNAANACGFYNDVAVTQLAKLVPGLRAVHASPGVVRTAWGTEMPPYIRVFVRAIQLFATPAEKAASMLVEVLLRKEDGGVIANSSGKEFAPLQQMTPQVSDAIWKHTQEVLRRIR